MDLTELKNIINLPRLDYGITIDALIFHAIGIDEKSFARTARLALREREREVKNKGLSV